MALFSTKKKSAASNAVDAPSSATAVASSGAGSRRRKGSRPDKEGRALEDCDVLMAFKPYTGYVFHSDYFKIDKSYATIISYFHDEGASDGFGAFWGVNRIPRGLDSRVSTIMIEQVHRMSEGWIEEKLRTNDKLDKMDSPSDAAAKGQRARITDEKRRSDRFQISQELVDGAAYLHVHDRMLVKAPTLALLDESVDRIANQYKEFAPALKVDAYMAEQRRELSHLWSPNASKRGKGFYFTSPEYAGSYHLVTNGVEDKDGEYIGQMDGDVNSAAILVNLNRYRSHVVVASDKVHPHPLVKRSNVADMWGSKISQSCMLNNGRVVHLVLNGAKLDVLGPRLDAITYRVNMDRGDLNMFEMFGKVEDELSIFAAQINKLVLMFQQMDGTHAARDAVSESAFTGFLKEVLQDFYVDRRVWSHNAKEDRADLRVVGVSHEEVPQLHLFKSYVEQRYEQVTSKGIGANKNELDAFTTLRNITRDMMEVNGDLFDTVTSSEIDGANEGVRVLYDFSSLLRRGVNVAMAQLVNVIGFSVSNLSAGDTVVIHGAELIEPQIKKYVSSQLHQLQRNGGRVVYLYDDIERMIEDKPFNRFDRADYTIMGTMTEDMVDQYETSLKQTLSPGLHQSIVTPDATVTYLHRGTDNIVFDMDISLGINPGREKVFVVPEAPSLNEKISRRERRKAQREQREDMSRRRVPGESGHTSGAPRLSSAGSPALAPRARGIVVPR